MLPSGTSYNKYHHFIQLQKQCINAVKLQIFTQIRLVQKYVTFVSEKTGVQTAINSPLGV